MHDNLLLFVGNRAGIIWFLIRGTLSKRAAVRETLIINLWLIAELFAEHRFIRRAERRDVYRVSRAP
ncbi:MAG TPA: hypothetical protein VF778_09800 [Xanthobacteraceae bacterium]